MELCLSVCYLQMTVLVDETKDCMNTKLEIWRTTSESRGLKLSKLKIEYMEC